MLRLVHAGLAVALAVGTTAAAAGWVAYHNPRFGTVAEVPAGLVPEPGPTNGDGRTWILEDGGEIAIWGGFWEAAVDDWEGYRAQLTGWERDDGLEVTYAPDGDRWFVISGLRGRDIVYLRVERSARCPAIAHHVRLVYPRERKTAWDPIVTRASKSLREGGALECG